MFLNLAFKNISRHKRRNLLTATGITISIALLFAILSTAKGFESRMERELQRTGIDFLAVPVGCPHEVASLLFYGKVPHTFFDQAIVEEIKRSPGIEIASPLIVIQLPDPEKKRKVILYGYEPIYIKKIKPDWTIKGETPAGWEALRLNKILVGSDIAKKEGLKIGDTVRYAGWTFLVSGILERTFSKDDASIYTDLDVAQEVAINVAELPVVEVHDPTCILVRRLTDDPISAVAVKLMGTASFMAVKEDLMQRIPNIQIVTVSEATKSVSTIAASAKVLAIFIGVIAILISAAGVINSMLMTVFEQRKELGMMRAIGATRSDIFRMTINHAIILTGIGAIAGIILTVTATPIIEGIISRLTPFAYGERFIAFDIKLAVICFLLSLVLGVCSGLYPAWKASRVSPIEAIRSQ